MRLDYDPIAHLYDERTRDHTVDAHLIAFLAGRDPAGVRVVDVGCGTGKQLAANRGAFAHLPLIGVDVSFNMLRVARDRAPSVLWTQGDGQALPLTSASADYVTNQFSYAHIPDKLAFFSEVFRVLRQSGRFVLRNIDPWSMPDWIIYRFFPEARAVDYVDFLPVDTLVALLRQAGFAHVEVDRSEDSKQESLREFLARGRHTASQFNVIPDAAYEAGRRRVHEALGDGRTDVTLTSRAALIAIRADKI
jgi:ubiquinone/menaquinone biosynthesis C-methylase UbiE